MSSSQIYRIIKSGSQKFWRNRWISSATILTMVITLAVMTSLIMVNVISDSLLASLQDKVDISVYFLTDAQEDEILKVKGDLEGLGEVKEVEYVSRSEALRSFKEKHKDNPVLLQSLEELGSNPLEASLNVKAQVISQYDSIANFLETGGYEKIIDKVNYRQNKNIIDRLSNIISTTKKGGLIVSLVLALIVVLVTFNTIRLTIYNDREEIGIMRLVGASNLFIRGPFIVEGIIFGLISAVITLIVMLPLVAFLSPRLSNFLPGIDIMIYFKSNMVQIFLIQLVAGIALGIISSSVAIGRYLKV